ncbi:MAG: DegT/DnrJ/EryC1/StrS family aminotransferase [Cyanobacteria bacterium P01_E01_bin.42]
MNKIPPFELTRQYRQIGEEVDAKVLDVLRSGRYIGGQSVTDFEAAFTAYIGTEDCVGCNSGTDALYLALRALNIGEGDEVITSPFTFIATAETISEVKATPVFVDIDPTTFNFDPDRLEAAITPKTKAIMPVHLFGRPVEMTGLMEIAQKHNITVVEDCAQATGAEWMGKKVGNIGHIGCFSFFPTKNLGAFGDGGAVTTNDPEIAATVRMLKEHGQKQRYIHDAIGVNSRLDALQAAILTIKLRYLDEWNERRSRIAQRYRELLQPLSQIALPSTPDRGKSVWNQFTLRILSGNRDEVRDRLQEKGIGSMIYYPRPLHLQPVYQYLNYQPGQLSNAESVAKEVLSLPMFPELSEEEQDRIAYGLKDCF